MNATLKKLGLTPAKAILIGVLLLVFIAIWAPQLMPSGKTPSPSVKRRPPRVSPFQEPSPQQDKKPLVNKVPKEKIEFTLVEATEHDPFAIPSWSPQAAVKEHETVANQETEEDDLADRVESLQSGGADMLLVSERGRAATLNGEVVYVGDIVDGFRVIDINDQGVFLTPIQGGEDDF